jgi:filamentous hemagglutinin
MSAGRLVASGDVTLIGGSFDISKLLASDANLRFEVASLRTNSDAIIQARGNAGVLARNTIALEGTLYAAGDVSLTAGGGISSTSSIYAGRDFDLASGGDVVLAGSTVGVGNVSLTGQNVTTSGDVLAGSALTLSASNQANLSGQTQASIISISARSALNVAGSMSAREAISITAGATNLGASVRAGTDIGVNAASLVIGSDVVGLADVALVSATSVEQTGSGFIYAGGSLGLISQGGQTLAGTLVAGDGVNLRAGGTINASGRLQSGGDVSFTANDVLIAGLVAARNDLSIFSSQSINLARGGDVQAGGNLAFTAGRDQNLAGSLATNGSFVIAARGDVVQSGVAQAGAAASITAREIALTGDLASVGPTTLTASNNLASSRTVFSGQDLIVTATTTQISGQLASGNNLTVDASGSLNLNRSGFIYAAKDIALNVGNGALLDGRTQSGAAISLNALDVGLSGELVSGGPTSLFARRAFTTSGTLFSAGNLNISAGAIALDAQVASTRNVTLRSGTSLNFGATSTLYAGQDVNLFADADILLAGRLQSERDALIRASNLSVDGAVTAGGGLRVTALSGLASGGLLYGAGDVDVRAGRATIGGQLSAGRNLILAASQNLDVGDQGLVYAGGTSTLTSEGRAQIDGTLQARGATTIQAASASKNGDLNSGGRLTIAAADEVATAGTIFAAGAIDMRGRTVAISGQLASDENVNLDAANTVTLSQKGLLFAQNNIVSVAGADARLDGKVQAQGEVSLQANNLTITNSLTSGGALSLRARDTLATGGDIYASGNLNLAAGNAGIGAQLASARDLTISTVGSFRFGSAGLLFGQSNLNLVAGGSANLDGDIQSGGDVGIAATSLVIGGDINSARSLSLASLGLITTSGNIFAQNNLAANGANISILGQLAAGGNITIGSSGAVNLGQTGLIFAGAALDLVAGRDAQLAGKIQSLGNAVVNAGTISLAGDLTSGGALNLIATQAVRTDGSLFAERALSVSAQSAHIAGQLASNSDVSVTTRDAFTINQTGLVFAGGTLNVVAGTAAQLDGKVQAGGDVTMRATSISVSGDLTSGSGLSLSAGEALVTSGTIFAQNDIRAIGRAVSINGQLASGGTINVAGVGDINLGQNGLIFAGGGLDLTAGRNAQLDGVIQSTGTTNISANSVAITNALSSGGALNLAAINSLATSGAIFAQNDINVTAGGDALLNAAMQSGGNTNISTASLRITNDLSSGGLLSLTATNGFTNSGNIYAIGDINIQAGSALLNAQLVSSGNIALASGSTLGVGGDGVIQVDAGTVNLASRGNQAIDGTVYSGGSQTYQSGGSLSYQGAIFAGGDVGATAQDISLSSDLVSNGAANFAATNRFLSRGNIFAENGVSVRAGSAQTEGGTIGANEDISIIADTGVALAGNLQSGSDVRLTAGTNLDQSGTITNNGQLAIGACQNVTLQSASRVSSVGRVSLVGYESININGEIVSDNDVTATYGNEATLFGAIATRRSVAFTNQGSGATNLVGQVTALENVSVTGGNLTLSGSIENAGSFSFNGDGARSNVSLTGQIRSDAGVSIDRAARITLAQSAAISSNQHVDLGAAIISIGGTIRSGGDITIASLATAGRVDISGLVVSNANTTITSLNGLILTPTSQIFAGGSASLSGANILAGGSIGATQVSLATLKTGALGGDGGIVVSGAITAADRIDINAAGKVEIAASGELSSIGFARNSGLGRDVGQLANISVVGADSVTNNGKIVTDGSVFLNSLGSNVVNNVELTGATAVVLQAVSGTIFDNGGVTTANLGLISGDEFVNNKDYAISGSILIEARNIINNASLSATNNLFLVSATDINNFGVLRAGGDMALVAAGNVNLSAAAPPLPVAATPVSQSLSQIGQADFVPASSRIATLTPSIRAAQLQFGYLSENTRDGFQIEQAPTLFDNQITRLALEDTQGGAGGEVSLSQVAAVQTASAPVPTTSVQVGGALLIQAGGALTVSNVGVIAGAQIDLSGKSINLTDALLSNGVGAINLFAQGNLAIVSNRSPLSIDAGGAINLATGRTGAITLTNTSLAAHGAVDIFTGTFAMTGQSGTNASIARIDGAGINIYAIGALSLAGAELASRDSLRLGAGTDLSLAALTSITRTDQGGGNTNEATAVLGVKLAAANDLILFARNDINLNAASLLAGGQTTLLADNAINITGTRDRQSEAKVWANGNSTSVTNSFIATTIESVGNLNLGARTINLEGAALVSSAGNIGLDASGAININAGTSTFATTLFEVPGKRQTHSATSDGTINTLTSLNAAGNITLGSGGALTITGGELIAAQNVSLSGADINVAGVVDVINSTDQTYAKKKGFLSSKTTTTNTTTIDESVILSTISGQNVTLRALGDINVLGTQTLAEADVLLDAGGNVDIATLTENDFQRSITKVKRSGFSIGNGGIFLGTKKTSNDTTQRAVVNTGSLLASNAGDVTIDADKDLVITGSQIFAANRVALYAEAINIRNALDSVTTNAIDKTSQTGLTLSMSSPLISSLDAIYQMTRTAATTRNDRVRVVSVAAAAVATRNAYDAVRAGGDLNTLASSVADGKATNLASLRESLGQVKFTASLGTQSTRNETDTTSQTVLGSNISGGDIIMVARGAGSAGAITISGSTLEARNDLTASANGAIIIQSALERDTLNARSSSFNASIGVSAGSGGFTVDGAIGGSKGKVKSEDTRFIESVVRAGGVLRISTPDAVRIEGGMVYGNQIVVNAGRLDIISQQDSSTYRSSNNSYGLQASVPIGAGSFSVSANVGRERQRGDFLSVQEQSGLYAGAGGYDITVAGNTNLVGAVIASEADRSRNRLTTGTLSASNLENRETYQASSVNLSASLSGSMGGDKAAPPPADAKKPAGLATPLGNLTAGTPSAMSASGNQSSTTVSAIADGEITITSGDAASIALAGTISRDTSTANTPLTREYDDAKRQEIAQGFEATRTLTTQVATFFENRGREQAAAKTRKEGAKEDARKARENGNEDDALRYDAIAAQAKSDEDRLQATYASGSPVRVLATAITGAASGNVTGSLESLGTAVLLNVAQSLVTNKVKTMVEKISDANARETTRAALQAVVACAGASASGGDCGASALGAATSVVLNNLLRTGQTPATDKDGKPLSLEEQQERTDLVVSLIAGLTLAGDGDVTSAANAGRIESENNAIVVDGANYQLVASTSAEESRRSWQRFFTSEQGKLALEVYASERATKSCLGNGSSTSCNASQQKLNTLITAFGDAKTVNQQLNAFMVDDLVGIASSALQIVGPQNAPAFLGDVLAAADGSSLKTRQILVAIETGQYTWTGLRDANRDQSIADGGKFVSNFLSPAQPYTISADGKLGCYAGGALCIPGDQARRFNAITQINDLQAGLIAGGIVTAGGAVYVGAPVASFCAANTGCITNVLYGTSGAAISISVDTGAKALIGEEQTLGGVIGAGLNGAANGIVLRGGGLRRQIYGAGISGGASNFIGQGIDILNGQIDPKTGRVVAFNGYDPFIAAGTSALGVGLGSVIPDVKGPLVQSLTWRYHMNLGGQKTWGQISQLTVSSIIRDSLRTVVDVPYNASAATIKNSLTSPPPPPLPPIRWEDLNSPNPATNPLLNRNIASPPSSKPSQGP